jgi:hypothetical protein
MSDRPEPSAVAPEALPWLNNNPADAAAFRESRWAVHFICCDRDNGVQVCATWADADSFRESYTSGPYVAELGHSTHETDSGHRRAGVVKHAPDGIRLGYWKTTEFAALPALLAKESTMPEFTDTELELIGEALGSLYQRAPLRHTEIEALNKRHPGLVVGGE